MSANLFEIGARRKPATTTGMSKKKRKREKKRNKEKTDERIRREKERDVCPRDAGPPHFLAIGSQFGKEDEGRTGGRERQTRLF